MTPKELAEKMSATPSDVIKRLIKLGVLVTINTPIDPETIGKVAQQFGYTMEKASPEEMMEAFLRAIPADEYPYLREMVVEHAMKAGYDEGADFEFGLDLILDGLQRLVDRATG